VIRGWLGHANLDTTHRYAEITLRMKQAAVATCLPPVEACETYRPNSRWRKDEDLMKWLVRYEHYVAVGTPPAFSQHWDGRTNRRLRGIQFGQRATALGTSAAASVQLPSSASYGT
jgi:hypothetical protein